MSAATAYELYAKLRPFLEVIPSAGCYTPTRGPAQHGDHRSWPLHDWRGPGTYPLVLKWSPLGSGVRAGERTVLARPTFDQFCRAYRIVPEMEAVNAAS
jgi:hypothetical protein